jgi:DNA/RNA-binding domain of Phe-tRNA-synthetase-like protein
MSSPIVIVSPDWKTAYPGACAGILVMSKVVNPEHHAALTRQKADLETRLRSRFTGYDRTSLAEIPVLQAYNNYFKQFKKTYHVQLQLESVAFKGKPIPNVAGLVEAMFMAELENMLLTAGHDLDALQLPVTVDVAKGEEHYLLLNGREQIAKAGDMMMADGRGVISSVLYGPDQRTRIMPNTSRVLFMVYVPAGIQERDVHQHLHNIQTNVLTIAPDAQTDSLQVYGAK